MIVRPAASQWAKSILMYSLNIPLPPCCVLYRWAWSRTEEDLHQMGKLSLRPGDLSHWGLVYRPAWWPHANPPTGSALRRTAGEYHRQTTHLCSHRDPGPQLDLLPAPKVMRKEIMRFIFFFYSNWLPSLLLNFFPLSSFPKPNFNLNVLSSSSLLYSQSPLRAACASTAWRMLIKLCSFSRSKKSI